MEFGICTVAAAPVRKEAAHRSEMVNQLLFGETMMTLDIKGEWLKVRSLYDGYEGWLTEHLVSEVPETLATSELQYIAKGLTNPVTLPDQLINAPMGAHLTAYDAETRLLWNEDYKYHGTFRDLSKPVSPDQLDHLVQAWINAPYLWGGKTFMGVDCSGFVQTIFKVLGVKIKRDAWQQAEQGSEVKNLKDAKKGDLAFFTNPEGRVVHVGILIDPDTIVHASGKVRKDRLDEKGITSRETGKRTHQLFSVKRYF